VIAALAAEAMARVAALARTNMSFRIRKYSYPPYPDTNALLNIWLTHRFPCPVKK
jgi:hypothetical protein